MPPKFPKTTGRRKEWRAIGSLPIYELFGCGEFCLAVAVMIASEKSAWSATTRPRRSNAGRVAEHRKVCVLRCATHADAPGGLATHPLSARFPSRPQVVEKAAKGAGGAKQPAVVGSAVATPEARPHKCNICGGAFKRLGALTEHQCAPGRVCTPARLPPSPPLSHALGGSTRGSGHSNATCATPPLRNPATSRATSGPMPSGRARTPLAVAPACSLSAPGGLPSEVDPTHGLTPPADV